MVDACCQENGWRRAGVNIEILRTYDRINIWFPTAHIVLHSFKLQIEKVERKAEKNCWSIDPALAITDVRYMVDAVQVEQ